MTSATLSFQKNVYSKVGSFKFPAVNWKLVCCVGFFACLSLLVFYVFQINDLTKGAYAISSYERNIAKLSNENKNLQVSFAESSFLGQALEKIQALNFQKTTSVKYIQVLEPSVAKAN